MHALQLLQALIGIGGILFWIFAITLLVAWSQIRPWDASNRDHSVKVAELPYLLFAFGCYSRHFGSWLVNNVPAPMLAIDIASTFLKSQVLFAVVNLGIPDALSAGRQTASQLAEACGCKQLEQLERILKAATVLGIVIRKKRKTAAKTTACWDLDSNLEPFRSPAQSGAAFRQQALGMSEGAGALGAGFEFKLFSTHADEYEYHSNHVTACLCKSHKSSMAALVKLYEYNYKSATSLTKSLLSSGGVTSHKLETGQAFWDDLATDSQKGAVFDAAMHSFKDLGGASVLAGYYWGQYSTLIDIAGGNGSFMATLLAANPRAAGMVMDQDKQVERGLQWWQQQHPELLSRVQFKAGDMFDGDCIPPPPAGQSQTGYILRNILHNWPDKQALKILQAIRAAIPTENASRVKLVIIELTSSAAGMPPCLEPRLMADIQMLCLFGEGKERDKQQFEALLQAAGFRLQRIVPTVGLLVILEAVPIQVGCEAFRPAAASVCACS